MSKKIYKLLTILLTAIICFNVIFPTISVAETEIPKTYEEWRKIAFYEFDNNVYKRVKSYKELGYNVVNQLEDFFNLHDFMIDTYEYISKETYNNLQSNAGGIPGLNNIIDELNDYYKGLRDQDYESMSWLEYIDYVEKNASEDLDSPEEIKIIRDFNEFEEEVRKYLDSKSFNSAEEKLLYLKDFENNWASEFSKEGIECGLLEASICADKVRAIVNEIIRPVGLPKAVEELRQELENFREEKEQLLKDLDEDTKAIRLKEEFEGLKEEYRQKRGSFYDTVNSISMRIPVDTQKAEFLENVPKYIDEFLEGALNIKLVTADSVLDMFNVTIDSVAGVILWPVRVLLIVVPGAVIQFVESLLANVGSDTVFQWITLDDIFFNNLALTDIDIFNYEKAGPSKISEGNVLYNIRKNVSGWYYAIRNLCIALAFVVLVYIGIRMAISSIADDRAKYKKMLKDWLVSMALIFVLHYFMVFIVIVNNQLVESLNDARINEEKSLATELYMQENPNPVNVQDKLLQQALSETSLVKGFAYSIVYFMLVAMMLLFLILYVKRMVTICFLAMIAPLITVTYAIDKAGDGKAQAFGKWMGEFVFNVLIQPFHCIIYMVFLQNIFYVINNTTGVLQIGKVVVAIAMLGFVYKAEDIIKSIFGFQTSSLSSAAVLGGAMLARAQSAAKKGKGIKDAGKLRKNIAHTKNPSGLPSSARSVEGSNVAQNNMNNSKAENGEKKKPNVATRAAKGTYKKLKDVNIWTGKKIANNVLGAAAAYGMTGDTTKAYGAHTLLKSGQERISNARLKSAINERKELTRDAYQDYAQNKGLDTREKRDQEIQRISKADPNTLDAQERNMREWMDAEAKMYEMSGSKDPMKDVLKNLSNYEDEQ